MLKYRGTTFPTGVHTALAEMRQETSAAAIVISVSEQALFYFAEDIVDHPSYVYPVSTSKFGTGSKLNSYQTPLGRHVIAEKIGADCDIGEIFKARQPQGCCAELIHDPVTTRQEHITSRILRLRGCIPGLNRGGNVDSYRRYIYIHGTHEEGLIGQPVSMGCVRMKNKDIIQLFECVDEGTPVNIVD